MIGAYREVSQALRHTASTNVHSTLSIPLYGAYRLKLVVGLRAYFRCQYRATARSYAPAVVLSENALLALSPIYCI